MNLMYLTLTANYIGVVARSNNIMDSAGGTVTTGRDRNYQAVYKLRGKVLNTYGMELHKARKNNEIDDLISILRCGTGEDLVIENCKFNKIIVLADSDDDGLK